nr:MAG TPA: hypothetical protein [Caudoviricetes sp.]
MFTQVYHAANPNGVQMLFLCDFWRCAAIVNQRLYTPPNQP